MTVADAEAGLRITDTVAGPATPAECIPTCALPAGRRT